MMDGDKYMYTLFFKTQYSFQKNLSKIPNPLHTKLHIFELLDYIIIISLYLLIALSIFYKSYIQYTNKILKVVLNFDE